MALQSYVLLLIHRVGDRTIAYNQNCLVPLSNIRLLLIRHRRNYWGIFRLLLRRPDAQ